jgi:hypothetical protein
MARDVLEKCGFTENDYYQHIASEIIQCEAKQIKEVEKLANAIADEKSSLSNLDDFEVCMGVNKIIQQKLKNLC